MNRIFWIPNLISLWNQEKELEIRPGVVEKALKELGRLEDSLVKLNSTKPWIPLHDLILARVKLNDTIKWINVKVSEQAKLADWEPLAFRSSEVESKVDAVSKQVEKLKRMTKPKPKVFNI